ncbi:FAD-binding protein, partial [Bacteriovoracaceae bacterium]|nr:FAD-binding protein [Bacteriovoracaceae bacterium]
MKILICSLQVSTQGAKGHFMPAVEIALQAKRSGHDVALLPLPCQLGDDDIKLCKNFGIRLLSTPPLPQGIIKNKEDLAKLASNNSKTHMAFKSFMIDPLKYQYKALMDIIRRETPDVIVNDLLLYLPTIISNKLNIINYGYCAGFKLIVDESLSNRYKDYYKLLSPDIDSFLNETKSNLRFKNLECLTKGGNFVFLPAQINISKNDNTNVKCIGSLPNSLDKKELKIKPLNKPYAVLSFGSVLDPFDYPSITQKIIQFCANEGLHLFISTKKSIDDKNITAMPYLPINQLLNNAKLYIHHGGANSFNEATRSGAPQILIPLTTDQPIQADILKNLGHGFSLDKKNITLKILKDIILEFQSKTSFVNKKRLELKDIFSSSNGAMAIIQEIEKNFYQDNIYGESLSKKKVYFPKTIAEVQEIIKNANILKENIYPISSAKSYGMGTKINFSSKASYLDLKYLKKISNYDEQKGVIEIESGVTQKELSTYLEHSHSKYTVNVTGSSEDSSIVANITDKGIGHFNEREKDVISLKVIAGNGNFIETGGAVFSYSQISKLYSSGLGPNFNSIFLQSNFGVVVSAVIKLIPKRDTLILTMTPKNDDCFSKTVSKINELILKGILTESVHISNKNRKESVLVPLLVRKNNITFQEAKKHLSIKEDYFVTTSLRTDSRLINSIKNVIFEELNDLCKITFTSKDDFAKQNDAHLTGIFNHSFGIPSDDAILSLGYEFERLINPKRMEQEGIGTFFLVPLIPFDGSKIQE